MSRQARAVYQHLGFQAVAILLWLLISVTLIAAALLLGRGSSQGACTAPWAAVCAGSGPAGAGMASAQRVPGGLAVPAISGRGGYHRMAARSVPPGRSFAR
jgi:hypothetical protein